MMSHFHSILYLAVIFLLFIMNSFSVAKGEIRIIKIDNPVCTLYLPDKTTASGRCVVILPGGCYKWLATDKEGHDWAHFFNDKGISVAVLEYKMPDGNREIPIKDAIDLFKLLRKNAKEWNINPSDIGIMGHSAGGHLASMIATLYAPVSKPSFQILFYPMISLEKPLTHEFSMCQFLGDSPSEELRKRYSSDRLVCDQTPQTIIFVCDDDDTLTPLNSIVFYRSLNEHHISASLHIYPSGGHGWGYESGFPFHQTMLLELSEWIDSF